MTNRSSYTPTMLRQCAMPGFKPVWLVARFAGRIAPTSADSSGGAP